MADPQIPPRSGGAPAQVTIEVSPEPTGPFDPPDDRLSRIDTLSAALRNSKSFGSGPAAARDLAASAEGERGKRLEELIERFERARS